MLKALKSYMAFTNHRYKLIMLVIMPILLVWINVNIHRYEINIGFASLLLLCLIDKMSEDYFMGGFCEKGNSAVKLMQSSPSFRKIMQDVAVVDAIRRVIFYQIPYVTVLCCSMGDIEAMEYCHDISFVPWVQALIGQIVVLISREYEVGGIGFVNGECICVLIVVSLIAWIGDIAGGNFVPVTVVLMVLILITIVGTAWHTDKKMEESYYD